MENEKKYRIGSLVKNRFDNEIGLIVEIGKYVGNKDFKVFWTNIGTVQTVSILEVEVIER
jgi:hypothetical protein